MFFLGLNILAQHLFQHGQARGSRESRGMSDEFFGPLDSAPVSEAKGSAVAQRFGTVKIVISIIFDTS